MQEDKETLWVVGEIDDKVSNLKIDQKGKATCTVDSLGRVNGFSITNWIGYTTTPSVAMVHTTAVSAAKALQYLQGDNGFHVTSFGITQAGFGYTVIPQVTLGFPPIFRSS